MGCNVDFKEIIGHKEIIAGLQNSIKNDRVGHAYIFSGPRGIGKRTVAGIFSALLICTNRRGEESCGECPACLLLAGNSNPDFCVIEPDGASISVDEIRKLQSDIIIKPLYSGRKVYLIIDADKMTAQAQNCLLKTLEEPPGYAVIILTVTNYEALMETIRSRALRYSFKKNTFDEVRELLNKRLGQSLGKDSFILTYADGVIGNALELAGSDEFVALREETLKIILKTMNSKLADVFDIYDFFEANKGRIDAVLDIMLLFYRDLLVAKKAGKENVLINSDKKDIILKNAAGFTLQKLVKNIETIEMTRRNIKHNANYQLSIEVMLMKLQEEDGSW